MPRKPSDGADRQSINVRTRKDLKQRLEQIAANNGRSLAQEVERRLEQSLDETQPRKLDDPLRGIFSDDTRKFLRDQQYIAQFLDNIADLFMHAIRIMKERGFNEIEIRTELRNVMDVLIHEHLWRPGDKLQQNVEAHQGTRLRDLPPGVLGYKVAMSRLAWLNALLGEGASVDTAEGRVRDLYSGLGLNTVYGPPPKEEESEPPRQSLKDIMGR